MKTLQQIDAEIAQCEQQLEVLHEQRREWVNHLGLNKRVIRAEDFEYEHAADYGSARVTHALSGKSVVQNNEPYKRLAHERAREHIVAELLAEGWVYAS